MESRQYRRSDLFLIRIWLENSAGSGKGERRGRVQRVIDGEAHLFNDWPALIELLEAMTADDLGPLLASEDVDDNLQAQDWDDE